MQSLLEKATTLIAVSSALMIALSVSHEWGYFAYVGGTFLQTFVTATDYFTNAILWLPVSLITVLSWRGAKLSAFPLPTRNPKTWIFAAIILGPPVLMFIFMSEGLHIYYLVAAIYLWVWFADWILPNTAPNALLLQDLRKAAKIAVPACAILFYLGYVDARTDMNHIGSVYQIRLKDSEQTLLRLPLRNFEKGLLVRDPVRKKIEFIRWDNVGSVAKYVDTTPQMTLVCRWFGWLCEPVESPL